MNAQTHTFFTRHSRSLMWSRLPILLAVVGSLILLPAVKAQKGSTPPPDPAIVYVAGSSHDLIVMNADGSNQTRILRSVGYASPCFSPDGMKIAFQGYVGGVPGLWVVNRDGRNPVRLTNLYAYSSGIIPGGRPRWSPVPAPDGHYKILFHDKVGNNIELFILDPDAANPDSTRRRLTNEAGGGSEFVVANGADWSRDATQIIACDQSHPLGNHLMLYTLGLNTAGEVTIVGEENLTSNYNILSGYDCSWPSWAIQSDQIVLSAIPYQGNQELWIVDLTPTVPTVRQLTTSDLSEYSPSWSPEDAKIIYSSNFGIHQINADGSGTIRLVRSGKSSNRRRF